MNWRGRPLTSHEVVVSTIAATRTRAGLRVEAALDTRGYPLGMSVSTEQMSALPLTPHAARGAWNYTIHPAAAAAPAATDPGDRHQDRGQVLHDLADPRLTGMSREELAALTAAVAPAQAARAEQRRFEQRGGPRRQARGRHGRPLLTDAARILITVIYQRQACSQQVLAEMLGSASTPSARPSLRRARSWPPASTPSRPPSCASAARPRSARSWTPTRCRRGQAGWPPSATRR